MNVGVEEVGQESSGTKGEPDMVVGFRRPAISRVLIKLEEETS